MAAHWWIVAISVWAGIKCTGVVYRRLAKPQALSGPPNRYEDLILPPSDHPGWISMGGSLALEAFRINHDGKLHLFGVELDQTVWPKEARDRYVVAVRRAFATRYTLATTDGPAEPMKLTG